MTPPTDDHRRRNHHRRIAIWAIAVALVVEAVALWLRFGRGVQATEFNRTAPLLLQIHHMFWSVPILIAMPLCRRWRRVNEALLGIAMGLIVSDLMHYFVVLPILVGNTGWHWP